MNYLYFAEASPVNSSGKGMMLPANRKLGLDPVSDVTSKLFLKDHNNSPNPTSITITHASGKHREVAELLMSVIKPSPGNRGKLIVVADQENGVYLDNGNGAGLNGVVTVDK